MGEPCVVWKFGLVPDARIEMPEGARVLCVQLQGDVPVLWALVNPDAPREIRQFKVVGTGHGAVDRSALYLSTFQMGELVWHVFEEPTTPAP